MAIRWSASHPPTEKSPSDPPVPRKLKVKTIHPMSRAMRSASSGNVRPEASDPAAGSGSHGRGRGGDRRRRGRARTWAASASPSTSNRSSTAAPPVRSHHYPGPGDHLRTPGPAFKEWAAVVQALLEGEQIIDVRKGGIREDGRHFSVQATRLWLYPTVEHQRPELLKPALRAAGSTRRTTRPAGPGLPRQRWADVVGAATTSGPRCSRRSTARSSGPREYVETRFAWKKRDPLWVLALRVHRLIEPIAVPFREAYAGCTSWVELDGLPDDPASLPSELAALGRGVRGEAQGRADAIPGGLDPPIAPALAAREGWRSVSGLAQVLEPVFLRTPGVVVDARVRCGGDEDAVPARVEELHPLVQCGRLDQPHLGLELVAEERCIAAFPTTCDRPARSAPRSPRTGSRRAADVAHHLHPGVRDLLPLVLVRSSPTTTGVPARRRRRGRRRRSPRRRRSRRARS